MATKPLGSSNINLPRRQSLSTTAEPLQTKLYDLFWKQENPDVDLWLDDVKQLLSRGVRRTKAFRRTMVQTRSTRLLFGYDAYYYPRGRPYETDQEVLLGHLEAYAQGIVFLDTSQSHMQASFSGLMRHATNQHDGSIVSQGVADPSAKILIQPQSPSIPRFFGAEIKVSDAENDQLFMMNHERWREIQNWFEQWLPVRA